MTALVLHSNPDKDDNRWFQQHRDRKAHIRLPGKVLVRTPQRGVYYEDENAGEFWSLGEHDKDRRRILLTRVDFHGKPFPENRVIKIPFLAFSSETIEDSDEVLLPLVRSIMEDQVKR